MSINLLAPKDKESLLRGDRVYKTLGKKIKIFYEYEMVTDFFKKEVYIIVDIFYPTHYCVEKYSIAELQLQHLFSTEKTSA